MIDFGGESEVDSTTMLHVIPIETQRRLTCAFDVPSAFPHCLFTGRWSVYFPVATADRLPLDPTAGTAFGGCRSNITPPARQPFPNKLTSTVTAFSRTHPKHTSAYSIQSFAFSLLTSALPLTPRHLVSSTSVHTKNHGRVKVRPQILYDIRHRAHR